MDYREWDLPFAALFAVLFLIVFLRAGITYSLGRLAARGGERFERLSALVERPGFVKARDMVASYGAPVVVLSFVTIGFQTLVNLSAGLMRMPWHRYLPALVVGGALWALIYSTVGFAGFVAVGAAYERWPVATVVVVGALVAAGIGYVVVRRRQRASRAAEPSA